MGWYACDNATLGLHDNQLALVLKCSNLSHILDLSYCNGSCFLLLSHEAELAAEYCRGAAYVEGMKILDLGTTYNPL